MTTPPELSVIKLLRLETFPPITMLLSPVAVRVALFPPPRMAVAPLKDMFEPAPVVRKTAPLPSVTVSLYV